jgi:protoporphyrinogen oxidase
MAVKTYDEVILGAGVAGLAYAWKCAKAGKRVLVLEKEPQIGGLAKSLVLQKQYIVDYCAHRFHTANKELLDTVLSLKYLKMYKIQKKTRIYMFGKYLWYPFELPNLLRAMPIHQACLCSVDFVINAVKQNMSKTEVHTYKDWFISIYGLQLYKVMCEPYTTKIWKMDPSNISQDWADQRFGGPNLIALIRKSIKKILTLDFSRHSLEDDALAPDGGNFYYPRKGFQEVPDAFARECKEHGGEIVTEATVTSIKTKGHILFYKKGTEQHTVRYTHLVSTIPIPALYYLGERKNSQLEKIMKKNSYMDIVFVYVIINKKQVSNDHWLYFPDEDIIFNRAVEFTNWSEKMAPKGKTCVCFDITCYKQDELWNMSDEDMSKRVVDDAVRIGYLPKDAIIDTVVQRVPYAYPVYDIGYKKRLIKTVSFLEKHDVYLLGRTGIFRYNNSDNSIEMALQLAKNVLSGMKNPSIAEYTMKGVSL